MAFVSVNPRVKQRYRITAQVNPENRGINHVPGIYRTGKNYRAKTKT